MMVGPKMQELKVSDPDKFSFKPKELLASITQIYINLGAAPEFIRAIANDGRSYRKSTFESLIRVLGNRAVMVGAEIESVKVLLREVELAKATIEIEDEREIPDEFLGKPNTFSTSLRTADYRLACSRPVNGNVDEKPGHAAGIESDSRSVYDSSGIALE